MTKNSCLSIAVCLCFASAFPAYALQKYPLNELERIEGTVSVKEINRIKVEGDRVKEIIGLHKDWQVESDGKNGQMFIRSLKETKEPATFTVITEKGKTQDIRLTPKNIKSEIIIIGTTGRGKKATAVSTLGAKHKVHDEIVEIMRNIALEPIASAVAETTEPSGIETTLLKAKKIGGYAVEIWQVRNGSENSIELSGEGFGLESKGIRAVGLEKLALEAGEVTQMYVVRL